MPPRVPKYVSPKQAAEDRARLIATLFWIAIALPVTFAVLAFGYSDQAPAFLRSTVIALDRTLGYPIAALIGSVGPR
ncbi:MAG: hypothetical protein EXQ83_08010 [Xanthobacteraceae bacterium]|nr:hypothetical protein [Xanthobacteraceae bacterium]